MATAYKRGQVWWIAFKDGTGERKVQPTKAVTKTEARKVAEELERTGERQRLGIEVMPTDERVTLGDLCNWWLAEKCPASMVSREKSRLGLWVLSTKTAQFPVRQVTAGRTRELRQIYTSRRSPRSSASTPSLATTPAPVPRRDYGDVHDPCIGARRCDVHGWSDTRVDPGALDLASRCQGPARVRGTSAADPRYDLPTLQRE